MLALLFYNHFGTESVFPDWGFTGYVLVASGNYEMVHQSFLSRALPHFCHIRLAKNFCFVFPRGFYP